MEAAPAKKLTKKERIALERAMMNELGENAEKKSVELAKERETVPCPICKKLNCVSEQAL